MELKLEHLNTATGNACMVTLPDGQKFKIQVWKKSAVRKTGNYTALDILASIGVLLQQGQGGFKK